MLSFIYTTTSNGRLCQNHCLSLLLKNRKMTNNIALRFLGWPIKLVKIVQSSIKYSSVIYFGAPSVLALLGIDVRPGLNGYYSQMGQDELVNTFFSSAICKNTFPKIFIDVGCNDPIIHSNSYFFEHDLGFQVLAIDALPQIQLMWKHKRPMASFVECAVGSSEGLVSFDHVDGTSVESMFSSVSGFSAKAQSQEKLTCNITQRTLANVFKDANITSAGILSMDIEGYEMEALRGIDFKAFMAYILIIENNAGDGLGSNRLRDYLLERGYIYFARIWNLDDIFIHSSIVKFYAHSNC